MFLHKILALPSGFIPDTCQLLSKFCLHDIINSKLLLSPRLCSKGEWKATVKCTVRASEYEL